MKTKIKKQKYFTQSKDFLVVIVGVVGILYTLNFGFGVLEILPDNIPFIGNIDEAFALFLVYSSAEYFGVNVKSLFKRK